jgi:hypothetical protein
MHPDVCRFVSSAMYDGRLQTVEGTERQAVASPGLSGAGVRLIEVEHAENRQCSPEEADRIAEEVAKLLDGGRYTDMAGEERDLTLQDILVVAPSTPRSGTCASGSRPARGSAPWTSSRARRPRWCSSR